jgi:hypothetical protein
MCASSPFSRRIAQQWHPNIGTQQAGAKQLTKVLQQQLRQNQKRFLLALEGL